MKQMSPTERKVLAWCLTQCRLAYAWGWTGRGFGNQNLVHLPNLRGGILRDRRGETPLASVELSRSLSDTRQGQSDVKGQASGETHGLP
jgi:hypothetical protein